MTEQIFLQEKVSFTVPFHDVDSMNIVWHGNYVKYLEISRSHFSKLYHIDAHDFKNANVLAPISKLRCKYKSPLFYQDEIEIHTFCYYSTDPKLVFDYEIFKKGAPHPCLTAQTEQLFLDEDLHLFFEQPPLIKNFFAEMQRRHLTTPHHFRKV